MPPLPRILRTAVAALVAAGTVAACSPAPAPDTTAHGTHAGSAPPAAPARAGERLTTVAMPAAYTPAAPEGGTDEYRCFLLDPGVAGDGYLTGAQFLPQNTDLVHHAILFRIPADGAERARAHDRDTPGDGWTCFGNAGLSDGVWVSSWAPGTTETLLRPDLGYPMPEGSLLVLQVHYNLLASGGRPGASDRSAVRLRWKAGGAGMTPLSTTLLHAPVELPCPAGASGPLCDRAAAVADVTRRTGGATAGFAEMLGRLCTGGPRPGPEQSCDHPVREAATVHAVGGHMHLLGRSITVELNPGRPGARTLLDIPRYDFDDQAIRPLDPPATVRPGDTLRVTCTHDAQLRERLPQLRDLPPRYVVWGEGTSDEMCLALLTRSPAG
jgi:hypothetical protein